MRIDVKRLTNEVLRTHVHDQDEIAVEIVARSSECGYERVSRIEPGWSGPRRKVTSVGVIRATEKRLKTSMD